MPRNFYKDCIAVLKRLHEKYPSLSVARHFSTATADYGDSWGMSDKELLFALEKYEAELELDHYITDNGYVDNENDNDGEE